MDAAFLRALFDSAYVLALAAWVGSLLFFTVAVAPAIFKVAGTDAGRRLVNGLLPRCYAWGTFCGAVALPAAMGVPLSFPECRAPRVGVQALAIIAGTLIMLYGGNSLTPALVAADGARFARLRRRSVWLNGVALAIGVALLIAFANRAAPRTAGIFEPTPQERARLEADAWRAKHARGRSETPIAAPGR